MIKYREAKKSEIKKIAELVAASFGEYPMYTLAFRDKFKTKNDFIHYMKKLNRELQEVCVKIVPEAHSNFRF